MGYAKINSITNANMAKVSSAAKAALGKISNIDAPSAAFSNTKSIDFVFENAAAVAGTIPPLNVLPNPNTILFLFLHSNLLQLK